MRSPEPGVPVPAPRTTGVGAVLTAALAPGVIMAVDPGGWYPFGPLRWTVTTVLVLGAAAFAAAGVARKDRSAPALPPVLVRACTVLVAAMGVAALAGADDLYAWIGTPERRAGVVFWAICALAMGIGSRVAGNRLFVPGLVLAGVVLGASTTAEALGWSPSIFDAGPRLTGLMGSSAFLGAACALLLPILVGVVLQPGAGHLMRSVSGVGSIGVAVALIGSGARAAWVGTAVAGFLAVWAKRRAVVRRFRSLGGRAAVLVVVVGVGSLGAIALLSPAGDRVQALFDDDAPGGSGRLDEWRVAGRVLARHPLTGVGPEGYRIAFAEGVDQRYESDHGRDPLPDRAHSGPLDVALAGGPIALGSWAVVVAVVGHRCSRALRSGDPVLAGVAAGLVAHWVGQLFLFPLAELEPLAWLLGGWVVASTGGAVGGRGRFSVGRRAPDPVRSRSAWTFAASLLSVLALVALVAGGRTVAADRAADVAATSGSVESAEDAVRLRPDVVRHHLLLARLRVHDGQGILSALDAVDDALAISPRDPVARLARARYLVDRAIATEVPAHAAQARQEVWDRLAEDPMSSQYWSLAVVLAALER